MVYSIIGRFNILKWGNLKMAFRQIKTPAIATSAVTEDKLNVSSIDSQTAISVLPDIDNDAILVYDSANSALRKITIANIIEDSITTDNLQEGSTNRFFTEARVDTEIDSYLVGGTGVTIASGNISIGQDVGTTANVTFATVTADLTGDVNGDVTSTGTSTFATVDINGGAIDGTVIGGTTAAAGNFTTIDASGNVTITGDLTVQGTTISVSSTDVAIGDNIIVLNADETGAPSQDAGIEIERGSADNARFIWDETNDQWAAQVYDSGTSGWILADVAMADISATTFTGNLNGDVLAADGTLVLDAGTDGTDATFTGDVTGDTTGAHNGTVGATTPSTGAFTTITASGGYTGDVNGDVNGNITSSGTSSFTGTTSFTTIDVNGGNIDGTPIGSSATSTGAFTTITASGGYTGSVTGNVTGNLNGDVLAADGTLVLDAGTDGTDATFTGSVTGNASSATALASARNFSITGDVTAPAISFDGTGNVALSSTLSNSGVTAGSYGSTTQIPVITVDSKGRITAVTLANSGASLTISDGAASDSVVVGTDTLTFAGGTGVTSAVTDNQVTLSIGQAVGTTDDVTFDTVTVTEITDGTATITGGAVSGVTTLTMTGDLNINNNFTINATTGMASGDLTGSLTGNADTATKLATARDLSLTGDATATIVGFDGSQNKSATLTLANSGVTAGTVGSATQIPVLTIDAKGRITGTTVATPSVSMSYQGDSGSDTLVTSTETLTFAGGTGLTSAVTANQVAFSLDNTSVTAGTYGSSTAVATIAIDAQGRITSASDTAIALSTSVAGDTGTESIAVGTDTFTIAGGTGIETAAASDTITVTLSNTGVTAGTVGSSTAIPVITFNAQGQITGVSTATSGSVLTMAADTGTQDTVLLASDVLTFTGGTGVATTVSDNEITIDIGQAVGTSDNVTFNDVTVSGTLTSDDITSTNVTVAGNATISGNLTVSGTTTTVNSTTVTIDDPVFTLGGDTAPSAVDSADRGIEFNWYDGNASAAKVGFMGWDQSAESFVFYADATNSGEAFTGTAADAEFGALTVTGITSSGTISGNLTGNATGNVTGDVLAADGTKVLENGTDGTDATFTGDVTGDLTGTADYADALSSAVTVGLSGDATGSATFVQSGDTATIATTLASTGVTASSYGDGQNVATFTVDAKGRLTAAGTAAIDITQAIAGDTGTDSVSLGTDTLTFSGGTGVATTITDNDVEIAIGQDVATTANVTFGGISVTNNVTIGGTTGITGEATLASATVSDLTAGRVVLAGTSGSLEDSGNLTFDGSTLDVTGAIDASGTITGGTLTDGTASFTAGALSGATTGAFSSNVTVGGTFDATGNSTIGGTLDITGATTATGLITGNGGFSGALTGNVTGTVSDISNHNLSGLGDVTITSATAGQQLEWNGSAWVNATKYFNVIDLADVDDTTLTGKGDYLLQVKADASGFELVDPATVSFSTQNRVTLNGDGSATTFSLGFTPNSGTLVFVGGIIQDPSTHYSFNASNQTITFTDTMPTGTSAVVVSADSSAVPYVPTNGVGTGEIQNNAVTSAKLETNIDIAGTLDVTSTLTADSDVNIAGNLTVTGNATISGNLTFGDAASDTVAFSADVASNMIPDADGTRDIGATATRYANVYADNLYGSLQELSDFAHFHSSVTVVSSGEATANASGTQAYTFSDLSTALTYQVFLNRQLLRPTEYSVSGSTLTISTGVLEENDELEVTGLKHTNA